MSTVPHLWPDLTPRQLSLLRVMLQRQEDEDFAEAEIVEEKGRCYLGDDRVSPGDLLALLRHCAVRDVSLSDEGLQRYEINETGRNILKAEDEKPPSPMKAAVRAARGGDPPARRQGYA